MQDPDIKSLNDECDPSSLIDLFSEIPPWVKHPDFERVSLKKMELLVSCYLHFTVTFYFQSKISVMNHYLYTCAD